MAADNLHMMIGNLTKDPVIRTVKGKNGDLQVANVSIATNNRRKKDAKPLYTDWTLWGKLAELAGEHLAKGSKVAFQGEMFEEEWEDKDGNPRKSFKFEAKDMTFLGDAKGKAASTDEDEEEEEEAPAKPAKASKPAKSAKKAKPPVDDDEDDDDVNF